MFSLQNALLKISIDPNGAELQKITSTKYPRDFMWDGNPNVWGSFSPNLFPIVGGLKNDSYLHNNHLYKLAKHGFARNGHMFSVIEQAKDFLTFGMTDTEDTLLKYPFQFEFLVTFQLADNSIKVTYTVRNRDHKTMYFAVGGHPAFKCPLFPNENYDDYSLKFDRPETALTHLLNLETGLFNGQTEVIFKTPQTIPLHHHLFDKDALVFKDLNSRKVTLESKMYGEILSVGFEDFPFLGIWAKPNGDFVCIEPWQGLADSDDSNQVLKDKEGIVNLKPGERYDASYYIEIHKRHLV